MVINPSGRITATLICPLPMSNVPGRSPARRSSRTTWFGDATVTTPSASIPMSFGETIASVDATTACESRSMVTNSPSSNAASNSLVAGSSSTAPGAWSTGISNRTSSVSPSRREMTAGFSSVGVAKLTA